MNFNRIISLLIALVYIVVAYVMKGGEFALTTAGIMVFILALIWFSDAIGSYTGFIGRGPLITQQTPGCIVRFLGWFFLLLPAVVYLIMLLRNKGANS